MSTHKKEWSQHTPLNVFVIHPYLLSCCMCLFVQETVSQEVHQETTGHPAVNLPVPYTQQPAKALI